MMKTGGIFPDQADRIIEAIAAGKIPLRIEY